MPRRPPRSAGPSVSVLRLGHRAGRDPRLTTHVALTARALGAERLFLHPPDPELAARVDAVGRTWGGDFAVVGAPDWRAVVRQFDGGVVHLTMYGEPIGKRIGVLRRQRRLLVVVGGAKVPAEAYQRATWNIAVGHQPHSEVAALAVLLEQLRGVPGPGAWPGAKRAVVPQARGKRVDALPAGGAP
jgi:tRNA (cytidine56-2'-O)-methyltransferase